MSGSLPGNASGEPRVTVLLAADRVDEPWRNGGGSTREIAAQTGPDGLAWRLSMAKVETDGPFSVFPGITRTIMVMDGDEMSLNVAGAEVRIGSEPFTFDGAATTHGALRGSPVIDFNVMVRRGLFSASTERIVAGTSSFSVPAAGTSARCTVFVVAPASGARLEIAELGLELELSSYDAVRIDGVATPLDCRAQSTGSIVAVTLVHDDGKDAAPIVRNHIG